MIEFHIPAISCGHCVQAVTRTVQGVDAAAQVTVDVAAKKVQVVTSLEPQTLAQALGQAGYPPA